MAAPSTCNYPPTASLCVCDEPNTVTSIRYQECFTSEKKKKATQIGI